MSLSVKLIGQCWHLSKEKDILLKRTLKWSMSGLATLGIVLAGITPASATESPMSDSSQMEDLISQFDLLGIDAATQDELARTVSTGGALESWTGVDPVASETWIDGGVEHTLDEYSDGSRALTTVELPQLIGSDGDVSPMSTSVCTRKAGSVTFSGCMIKRVTGGLVMSYAINGNVRNAANPTARITYISPTACSFTAGLVLDTNSYVGTAASTGTAWAAGTCLAGSPLGHYTYGLRINVTTTLSASEF